VVKHLDPLGGNGKSGKFAACSCIPLRLLREEVLERNLSQKANQAMASPLTMYHDETDRLCFVPLRYFGSFFEKNQQVVHYR
jgi:hypothetical protein